MGTSGDINCSPAAVAKVEPLKMGPALAVYALKWKSRTHVIPRFSEDTIIAFLSMAGDAFATMDYNLLLLLVIMEQQERSAGGNRKCQRALGWKLRFADAIKLCQERR